jgi:hypothetical protein
MFKITFLKKTSMNLSKVFVFFYAFSCKLKEKEKTFFIDIFTEIDRIDKINIKKISYYDYKSVAANINENVVKIYSNIEQHVFLQNIYVAKQELENYSKKISDERIKSFMKVFNLDNKVLKEKHKENYDRVNKSSLNFLHGMGFKKSKVPNIFNEELEHFKKIINKNMSEKNSKYMSNIIENTKSTKDLPENIVKETLVELLTLLCQKEKGNNKNILEGLLTLLGKDKKEESDINKKVVNNIKKKEKNDINKNINKKVNKKVAKVVNYYEKSNEKALHGFIKIIQNIYYSREFLIQKKSKRFFYNFLKKKLYQFASFFSFFKMTICRIILLLASILILSNNFIDLKYHYTGMSRLKNSECYSTDPFIQIIDSGNSIELLGVDQKFKIFILFLVEVFFNMFVWFLNYNLKYPSIFFIQIDKIKKNKLNGFLRSFFCLSLYDRKCCNILSKIIQMKCSKNKKEKIKEERKKKKEEERKIGEEERKIGEEERQIKKKQKSKKKEQKREEQEREEQEREKQEREEKEREEEIKKIKEEEKKIEIKKEATQNANFLHILRLFIFFYFVAFFSIGIVYIYDSFYPMNVYCPGTVT